MRFLVLARRKSDFPQEAFAPHLPRESRQTLRLLKEGRFREIMSRADGRGAIVFIEANSVREVEETLNMLPLAKLGMLEFEIIETKPYGGYSVIESLIPAEV